MKFGMPALALTDHGYLFGIPDFDLACRSTMRRLKTFGQWCHDMECFERGWDLERPPADDPMLVSMIRFMLSDSDVQIWNQTHNIEAVKPTAISTY